MSYAIVFSSKTGNTRLLADTLRASLPQNECTYFGAPAPEALEAETLYIGFWTDKGHADDTLTAFLQTLRGSGSFCSAPQALAAVRNISSRSWQRCRNRWMRATRSLELICARARCP